MNPKLFFILIIVSIICSCGGSNYNEDNRNHDNNNGSAQYNPKTEVHNTFEKAKKDFFEKNFESSFKRFNAIYDWQNYSDSVISFFNENFSFAISDGKAEWLVKAARDLGVVNSEITRVDDSIKTSRGIMTQTERDFQERKWVYIGDYNSFDKYGNTSNYFHSVYYDINHVLYEADSVSVVLKTGTTYGAYQYVSLNLNTKIIHGIDASTFYGESYNFVWDGDWWKRNNEFANDLFDILKK